ncbi:MAG: PH domain-containing protein [Oscillospiraceae bacterium]|nr:PH domain-containing protein [Oscillospiraceae bacterium]
MIKETIWQDRSRILGMPITFTKYALTEDRLFLQKGLLNQTMDEILLYRVRDISWSCSLGQRIFGVGTIKVLSSDKSLPQLELKNIKGSMEVKELLHKQVEEMKIARRMRVGELLDNGADHEDCQDELLDD